MKSFLKSYLIKMTSIIAGIVFIFTFGKIDLFKYLMNDEVKQDNKTNAEKDADALASDWQKAGNDLHNAIKFYDSQIVKGKFNGKKD